MKKFYLLLLNFFLPLFILLCILLLVFSPILTSSSVVFPYALNPFDIAQKYPDIWLSIKILYFVCFFLCYSIVYIYIKNNIHKTKAVNNNSEELETYDKSKLALKIGKTENRQRKIYF